MAHICGEDQASDVLDFYWFYMINFSEAFSLSPTETPLDGLIISK